MVDVTPTDTGAVVTFDPGDRLTPDWVNMARGATAAEFRAMIARRLREYAAEIRAMARRFENK